MNIINLGVKIYYLIIFIFIAIFFICLFLKFIKSDKTIKELWQDYKQLPYNYQLNGSDPLYFYRKDRFKKPYRYPYTFYKSYPTKHLSYLP